MLSGGGVTRRIRSSSPAVEVEDGLVRHCVRPGRPQDANNATTGRPQDDAERRAQRSNAGAHTPLRIFRTRGDATRNASGWFRSRACSSTARTPPRLPLAQQATTTTTRRRLFSSSGHSDSGQARRATGDSDRQATGDRHGRRQAQQAGSRHARDRGWPYWWRSWTWFVMGIMAGRAKLRSIRKTAHVGFSRARITARRLVTANRRPLPGSVPDWNDLGTNSQILGIPYC